MVAVNSGLFDRAVHAFDLAIGPGMLDLGQPVINVMVGASTLESMAPEQLSFCPHLPNIDRRPTSPGRIGELNAIVVKNSVDGVGNRCNEIVEELLRDGICSLLVKLDISKLAGAVDGHEEMQLSFCGSHFGDIPSHGLRANHCRATDVEIANRVSLELFLGRLVAFNIRQPFNAMTLKATMQ